MDVTRVPATTAAQVASPPRVRRRARRIELEVLALTMLFVFLAWRTWGSEGAGLDVTITRALQSLDHPLVYVTMVAISAFGFAPLNLVVFGAAIAGFWLRGFRREASYLVLALGATVIATLVKIVVHRPRPDPDVVRVVSELIDYSYPSGHVVSYVSFFGFLFFLFYVLFRRAIWRTVLLVALGALVLFIGLSRIYLGHHWASDVLGGYALGGAWLLVLIELYRARRPPLVIERLPGQQQP